MSLCWMLLDIVSLRLKASLHYGDYRPKLVPFEAPKNIFYI